MARHLSLYLLIHILQFFQLAIAKSVDQFLFQAVNLL